MIEITHQLPCTRADTITVIVDGKIAEHGNHTQLVAAAGPYQRLVQAAIS